MKKRKLICNIIVQVVMFILLVYAIEISSLESQLIKNILVWVVMISVWSLWVFFGHEKIIEKKEEELSKFFKDKSLKKYLVLVGVIVTAIVNIANYIDNDFEDQLRLFIDYEFLVLFTIIVISLILLSMGKITVKTLKNLSLGQKILTGIYTIITILFGTFWDNIAEYLNWNIVIVWSIYIFLFLTSYLHLSILLDKKSK